MSKGTVSQVAKLISTIREYIARTFSDTQAGADALLRNAIATSEADRIKRLVAAQTAVDLKAVRGGVLSVRFDDSGLKLKSFAPRSETFSPIGSDRAEPPQDFHDNARIADETRRTENIRATTQIAIEVLRIDHSPASEEQVDLDWFYRWRESASAVSNESLRRLWAKILAGEIKQPGSFSLRTLEFLRSVSREEAVAINKLANFVSAGTTFIWCGDERSLDKYGFTVEEQLMLSSIGILNDAYGLTMEIVCPFGSCKMYLFGDRGLVTTGISGEVRVQVPAWALSKTGAELSALATPEKNDQYYVDFGRYLLGKNIAVGIGNVVSTQGNLVKVGSIVPLDERSRNSLTTSYGGNVDRAGGTEAG